MDWTDPDTWKAPAALIEHWQTILVGTGAIIGILWGLLRKSFTPFAWLWSRIRSARTSPAERPLRFVQNEQQSFWGPARRGAQLGTQVSGHWHVTNTTDLNVVLLRVRLDGYPCEGHVDTSGFRDRVYSSVTPVPAESMAQVTANFICVPPITDGSAPLIVDLVFTDNYEREHRVPSRFRFIRS